MTEPITRLTIAEARWTLTGHGYSDADAVEIVALMATGGVDIRDGEQMRVWLRERGHQWARRLG